jgi:uncharacterized integral membrane protein
VADETPRAVQQPNEESSWRRWALLAIALVLALFMLLNSQEVEVNLIFGSAKMPLIFALLIAALLGALVGWAGPKLRRPRG